MPPKRRGPTMDSKRIEELRKLINGAELSTPLITSVRTLSECLDKIEELQLKLIPLHKIEQQMDAKDNQLKSVKAEK